MELVKLLVESGANYNYRGREGTALKNAIQLEIHTRGEYHDYRNNSAYREITKYLKNIQEKNNAK